jgi:hypothetical protein
VKLCNYRWQAPFVLPNGRPGIRTESCALGKDHQGDHKSVGGITYPNVKVKKGE